MVQFLCIFIHLLFYAETDCAKLFLAQIKKAPQKTEVLNSIVAIGIEPMTHGI